MAVVQKSTEAGEMTQLFIQFVMMQQHQALLALGRHPNPIPGSPPANLALGKALVEQLAMIQQKTSGNLNPDEEGVLKSALDTVQAAYQEATKAS
jgi:hypothetical protein